MLLTVLVTLTIARSSAADFVPGRILVKPKEGLSEKEVRSLFTQHGVFQEGHIHQIGVRLVKVREEAQAKVLEALQHNPKVEFAELDEIVEPAMTPNDPSYGLEWYEPKTQAPQAWDITTGSSTITIAIIDTGVEGTHPDLIPNLVPGWNFYGNNSDTSDVTGHGTSVAGVAAAAGNNQIGVAGMAMNCQIMPLRVTDTTGYALFSTMATALTYAADHGARVANLSFKASDSSSVTSAAQYMNSKGGVVTVSAGNDGTFDSANDNPYVLTISATDSTDTLASWSCTGNNIDLAAPGVTIKTTTSGGTYGSGTGTSFSAPVVAGVAALMLSANSKLSASDVMNLLKQNADDLGPAGWDPQYGYGRVNAYKAVLAATGGTPPATDTTAPTATITSPSGGSTVSGTISITASASDNVGVTKVELYVNGSLTSSSTSATPTFSWNTTTSANGACTLQVKAYDAAGNSGTSSSVSVTVQNDATAPTDQILNPSGGSTVAGTATVNVSASDNVGVTKVEWYLDNVLAGSSTSSSPTFTWNTTAAANGVHSLSSKAYDAAGNVGTSPLVTVTVSNTDTTAPTAQVTSPSNGATVSGSVNINIAGSDNVAVTKVECYLDGTLAGNSLSSTLSLAWDTTQSANGSHTIQAKAYDAAGNVGTSALVTVTVSNTPPPDTTAPTAQITAPGAGATVTGTVNVSASSSDNVGVTKVELYINGSLSGTSTSATANFAWDTTAVSNGSYSLQVKAYDAAGNVGTSASVSVNVSNPVPDTTAPTAQITSPNDGSTVSKTVKISVSANDNVGVTKVELYVDGSLLATDTAAPYTFSWNASKAAKGPHTLAARAYDAAGNSSASAAVTVYK